MSDCSQIEERLPLLRYGNELSADERVEVLAHLEECSACRTLRDQIEATAASLDAVPLERPDAQRLLGLKERVLESVGSATGCPREPDWLALETLDADARASLESHQADCASCQAFTRDLAGVGRALDLVPLVRPAGLDTLRERVLAEVGQAERRPRRGVLLRFAPLLAMAAAALLVAGLTALALIPQAAPLDAHQLSALKDGADELLRDNRTDEAVRIYRLLLAQGAGNDSPEGRRVLGSVQRSLDLIAKLEAARSSQDTELVITYYPDSPVVPPALAQWAAQKSSEPQQVAPAIQHQPTISLDPIQIAELRLSPEIRRVVGTSRSMQQVVILQQGLRYEELGHLASAQEAFELVIEIDPDTKAAELARAGLTRLG